jgi:hypothetical protein
MMSLTEYFWANLGSNIVFSIVALIVAIIFVAIIEQYFNVTLKNPGKFNCNIKPPVTRLPRIRNPMNR